MHSCIYIYYNSWFYCKLLSLYHYTILLTFFFKLQEAAYIKIHAEIADVLAKHARPVHTELFEDWSKFLDAFLSQGK